MIFAKKDNKIKDGTSYNFHMQTVTVWSWDRIEFVDDQSSISKDIENYLINITSYNWNFDAST